MKRRIAAAALFALLLTGCGKIDLTLDGGKPKEQYTTAETAETEAVQVIKTEQTSLPEPEPVYGDDFVDCTAAICYDLSEKAIVYSKNEDKIIYPASLTKLLTALTAIKYTEKTDIYTVGTEIELIEPDSSVAWISEGEQYERNDLLTAMLAPSGNDAAYSVAVNVARKRYGSDISDSDAVRLFADLMNDYAAELGCENTNFTVPDGYHDEEHVTTCADMLKISIAAAECKDIVDITSQPLAVVYDLDGYTHSWNNGNLLLEDPYTDYTTVGLKTGYTDEAGFCFIGLAELDGKRILTLAFGCGVEYRYEDTLKLMDLGFGLYDERKDYRDRLEPADTEE